MATMRKRWRKKPFSTSTRMARGRNLAERHGPAADAEGNLYVPTGNGTFDAASGGRDYGDSVLKLDGSTLAIRDYFTPHDQDRISEADSDVGSSGPRCSPISPARIAIYSCSPRKIPRSM